MLERLIVHLPLTWEGMLQILLHGGLILLLVSNIVCSLTTRILPNMFLDLRIHDQKNSHDL
jgi:hypothetical protein